MDQRLAEKAAIHTGTGQTPEDTGSGKGTGWDTVYAALFPASDEAKFITGALLTVDGGQSARIG